MRMKLTLSENIRSFRKERKMTQEQLATVLGVTVGAVYKWESGLSVPELDLIVEMADFFDTSVDVLLGCRINDNRLESIISRLYTYSRTLDPAGITEAEKALAKYPHSFKVVYACADLFLAYGTNNQDSRLIHRALELDEQAMVLLPQNDNPRISEASIIHNMSVAYYALNEKGKGVELLKQHNALGHFNYEIGSTMAVFMNQAEEAVPYLSQSLAQGMTFLLCATVGFVFVYRARGDWDSALNITTCCNNLISGLRADDRPGYMTKTHAEILIFLAYARRKKGMPEAARDALRESAKLTVLFDSAPEYSLQSMRFIEHAENTNAFDTLGATAAGSIEYLLNLLDDPEFTQEWKEIINLEQ